MKILIFLGNDAANLSIENIVRQLTERHEVKIIGSDFSNAQTEQMFADLADRIIPAEQFTPSLYDWADCVFSTVMTATKLIDCPKYIFTFCHMNPRFDEPRGYDFVFTLGKLGEQDKFPYFASMPVGLAKNDVPVTAKVKKQILYVDAGHFPFGKKGQQQIAQMLLNICQTYPDYNICVKPRWMPGASDTDMSNPNFGHIYYELEELCPDGLPENLELLREYRNLQELIDESECVVSSCTSAYLDAAMRGKPLLIIKGIENEDMYHLRNEYFENLYRFAEGSGCVVDWREVTNYLPEGRKCNPEHIRESFAYLKGATGRVIETMEFIFDNYISKGVYPDLKEYQYETYREQMSCDSHLQFKNLLCNRRFCAMETSIILTYKISTKIDWLPFYYQQYTLCKYSNNLDSDELNPYLALRKAVTDEKAQYLIDHSDFVKNDVDMSFLLYAMYTLRRYEDLIQLHNQGVDHSSLEYYVGRVYWALGQKPVAAECLKNYLSSSFERDYPKYITDSFDARADAFDFVFNAVASQKNTEEAVHYTNLFLKFAKQYPRDRYLRKPSNIKAIVNLLNDNGYTDLAKKLEPYIKLSAVIRRNYFLIIKRIAVKIHYKLRPIILKVKEKVKEKAIQSFGIIQKILKRLHVYRYISKLWHDTRSARYELRRYFGIYDDMEKKVLDFTDIHTGKACFIIGNGPSLRAEDLEKIQSLGYTCFASNKIYKIYDQTAWRPDYYACFDHAVFRQNIHEILDANHYPMFFSQLFLKDVRKYENVMRTKVTNTFYSRYSAKRNGKITFFPQAANIDSGGTVTFVLLELAWMMGFRKFYIIGCDHNYGSFQNLGNETKTLISNASTNHDYFIKNYMRPGEQMNVGDLDRSTKGYAIARDYIESHGGEIYNATRGGKLEVFKRVDLDELLSNTENTKTE